MRPHGHLSLEQMRLAEQRAIARVRMRRDDAHMASARASLKAVRTRIRRFEEAELHLDQIEAA